MNTFIHATSAFATSMFWLRTRDQDTLTLSSLRAMRAFQDSDIWLVDPKVSTRVLALASSRTRVVQLEGADEGDEKSRALALGQMRRYRQAGYSVARLQASSTAPRRQIPGSRLHLPLAPTQIARGVTLVSPSASPEADIDWVRLSHTGMTLVCYMGASTVRRLYDDLTAMGCRPGLRVTAVYYETSALSRHYPGTLADLHVDVRERRVRPPDVVILNGMMPL
ncbi:MAG: hypothetical protein WDA26_14430 [Pusillimonas sp.]